MTDPRHIAEQVTRGLGGQSNIISIQNCMTRLRIGVRDSDAVDVAALESIDEVLAVVPSQTMQVVLGPGLVDEVAIEMSRMADTPLEFADDNTSPDAGLPPATDAEALSARGGQLHAERKARNETPLKLFLRRVANIFLPLIPALIACGVLAGLNGVLVNLTVHGTTPWAAHVTPALGAIASGFMSLIAVFVGMNTAQEFGGTPILGGAVAAIIPFAGVAKVSAFGQTLAPGQGGVIGAMLAAALAVVIERWCRRWSPRSLSMLIVPTITVLVSGLVTVFVLMTLAGWVSTGIGRAATWLLGSSGALSGFVLGGLFLPLVMFGLHQALIPIHTTLIQQTGYTILLPVLAMAGGGQIGACIAVYMRARNNPTLRNAIRSALPAGLLGVGEPLIYGVTLPLGRPFLTACIGGAFGGGFIGLFDQLGTTVGSTAIGPSGWALFPLVTGNHGILRALVIYVLGLLIAYVVGWAATYFFGFTRESLIALNTPDERRTTPPTA